MIAARGRRCKAQFTRSGTTDCATQCSEVVAEPGIARHARPHGLGSGRLEQIDQALVRHDRTVLAVTLAPMTEALQEYGVEFGTVNVAIVFGAQVAARPVFSGNSDLAAEADRMSARYIEGFAPPAWRRSRI